MGLIRLWNHDKVICSVVILSFIWIKVRCDLKDMINREFLHPPYFLYRNEGAFYSAAFILFY